MRSTRSKQLTFSEIATNLYVTNDRTATSEDALSHSLHAVESSINIVERTLDRERAALQHDRFGRRASEMPQSLRTLYETGTWRNQNVYQWHSVLKVSKEGHSRAAKAEQALRHLHYDPPVPIPANPSLANAAVSDARAVVERIGGAVRRVLAARKKEREERRREIARVYMSRRREWTRGLEAERSQMTETARVESRRRDRELLAATRAPSGMGGGMTDREIDLIFSEIEAAGGTAGGLERWGRSITGIPDHNPGYLPPASDGGVLIDNPLAAHYAARNINPWTRAEKLLFLDKFLIHGKNFRKIASFFEHKSNEDVVRFYFDNKKQLKLKQLAKEHNVRRRGSKKTALMELSMLPLESRSIKDNFIHQEDFQEEADQEPQKGKEMSKSDRLSHGTLGRGWSPSDRRALIFALCRFDVTKDEEAKPVPTVWSSISSVVGSKTPRQCRQFYFQYKTLLGLEGYSPPKAPKRSAPNSGPSGPRKQQRRGSTRTIVRGDVTAPYAEVFVNGDG